MTIMHARKTCKHLFLLVFSLIILTACDNQNEAVEKTAIVPVNPERILDVQEKLPKNLNTAIENKSYLFDVTEHSKDEFRALLTRAEEISQAQPDDFQDLEIIMILHGSDINWFTQDNYEHNQQLIDLAARLDAQGVIDMKVCEQTMTDRGVARENLPPFIESVPYAPVEIENRLREGYINL